MKTIDLMSGLNNLKTNKIMIKIPIAVAVAVVIILHTVLTHLSNWGIRKTKDDPFGVLIILFSTIEIVIVISLLCNMKPV